MTGHIATIGENRSSSRCHAGIAAQACADPLGSGAAVQGPGLRGVDAEVQEAEYEITEYPVKKA